MADDYRDFTKNNGLSKVAVSDLFPLQSAIRGFQESEVMRFARLLDESSALHVYRSIQADSALNMMRRIAEANSGVNFLAQVAKQTEEMSVVSKLKKAVEEQERTWRAQLRLASVASNASALHEALATWNVGTMATLEHIRNLTLPVSQAALAVRLAEPLSAFTKFVRDTSRLTEGTRSLKDQAALLGSVRLAEYQLIANTDSLSAILVRPTGRKLASEGWVLNGPAVQRDELLAAPGVADDADAYSLIALSPAATSVEVAKSVNALFVQLMEVEALAKREHVFTRTIRFLEAYGQILWLIPTDRRSFADFVDCLYFLFYEGAGKDKLRFLSANGGVLQDTEAEFIWCIKHLRNKWTRHDVEHGKETDIHRGWRDLRAKFEWLGLQGYPADASHFRALHRNLLDRAEAFMKELLERMINETKGQAQ